MSGDGAAVLLVIKDAWVAHQVLRVGEGSAPALSRPHIKASLGMLRWEGVAEVRLGGAALRALVTAGLATGVIPGVWDRRVCLAIPRPHDSQLHLILHWARLCNGEQNRQYMWRVRMAIAQTMGGGWASVRNVAESLRWALLLQGCAEELNDEAAVRKCRVFIGWAHLWNGNRAASHEVFQSELRTAEEIGDEINANRCVAAEAHMQGNPLYQEDRGSVDLPDVAVRWSESFDEQ